MLALLAGAVVAVAILLVPAAAERSVAAGSPAWHRIDLHHHSVFSADGFDDLGIVSQAAKARGYKAIFLTDHNDASSFAISGLTANHMVLQDTLRRWEQRNHGTPTSTTTELVAAPVHEGQASLHLATTAASGYGETMVWTRRGPNLRSGDTIVRVAIRPTRIDPGTGIYLSAAFGGDASVMPPDGYTTQDGIVSPGKSTIVVWQLGRARTPSADPNARVVVRSLGRPRLGEWTTYTVNLNDALADIPPADRPEDYNAWTYVKIAAAGNGGTVDAYVDAFSIDASAPVPPGQEFAYRNAMIDRYDTADFNLIPAQELGTRRHAQRLLYASTDPADFVSYRSGVDGIAPAQAAGYPAMLNHPGDDGGLDADQAIETLGAGADLVEVRQQAYRDIWDAILARGRQILGGGSNDSHRTVSTGSFATYVRSSGIDVDTLARAIWEGRTFLGVARFKGELIWNLTPTDAEPYPARHPVYVGPAIGMRTLSLRITGGIGAGSRVRWLRNGVTMAEDLVSGTTYQSTKDIDLSGPGTVVRAELIDANGAIVALTQPIRFTDVDGLRTTSGVRVTGITTPDGRGYTRAITTGLHDPSSDPSTGRLRLPLTSPPGTNTRLRIGAETRPAEVRLDGAPIPEAATRDGMSGGNGSRWFYDAGAGILQLSVTQAARDAVAVVVYGQPPDTSAPTTPTGLRVTATGAYRVELSWSASSDDVAVNRYNIVRDGVRMMGASSRTTSFVDTSVSPDTTYEYRVEAVDFAGNISTASAPASARTLRARTTTFAPAADAFVWNAEPDRNFGMAATLRVSEGSRSYIRFEPDVSSGTVERVTLRLLSKTSSTIGYRLRMSPDNGWGETSVTWSSAPAIGSGVIGASGALRSDTWTDFDVTRQVTGRDPVTFVLDEVDAPAMAVAAHESPDRNGPRLVIETSDRNADTVAPTAPARLTAVPSGRRVALTWSASSDDRGVAGYRIRRDGAVVGSVGDQTAYTDTGLEPRTAYRYTVEAVDEAGNTSAASTAVAVTTRSVLRHTFAPVADGYVSESSPTTSYGTAPSLRADAAPVQRSYLRFAIDALPGPVERATLEVFASSGSSTGHLVHRVSSASWTEATLSWLTAPSFALSPEARSGSFAGGTWSTADVTALVPGPGEVSLELDTRSTTAIAYRSRESAGPPRLVVETTGP